MTDQKPIINKCCGIISNRLCLVVFALIKIVADIMVVGMFGTLTIYLVVFGTNPSLTGFCTLLLIDICLILDLAFMIIKIVGASVKCNHLLKVSYVYSILSLVVAVSASVIFTLCIFTSGTKFFTQELFSRNITDTEYLLIFIGVIVTYTLIHVLVILLIQSEITKRASNGHGDNYQESVVDGRLRRTSQLSYGRFV